MRLAIICGGRARADIEHNSKPLKYIGNSIEKVKSTLENNNWVCKENCLSKDIDIDKLDNFLLGLKEILKGQEVDEFLFYYTGHGKYGNSKSQVDFQLRLESEQITIGQLVETINLAFKNKTSPKMALVIDSCYSGEVVSEQKPYLDIEILTSTDNNTKSFEKVGLVENNPNYGISVFSHYFCNTFETIQKVDEICLKTIGKHVASCQSEQEPYYSYVQFNEQMVIGYNKEINELQNYIKNHYLENIGSFKKDILTYLETQTSSFLKIKEANTFEDLLYEFLMTNDCFYCLLKEINENHQYLKKLKIIKDCNNLKNEVRKSRTINAIILIIKTDTGNDISSCTIEGYLESIDGSFFSIKALNNINFNTDNYKNDLSSYLSELLEMIDNSEDVLELKLILSEALFQIDFYDLEVQEQCPLPIPRTILEKFNITTKLFIRFDNYDKKSFFGKWEKNGSKIKKLVSKKVVNHFCCIKDKSEIGSMDKIFLSGDKRKGESIDYVALISHFSLKEQKSLYIIISGGLPIVLYPQLKEEEKIEVAWLETSIEDIKSTTFQHITKEKNIHFLYDTYEETKVLKTATINNQIKDYK